TFQIVGRLRAPGDHSQQLKQRAATHTSLVRNDPARQKVRKSQSFEAKFAQIKFGMKGLDLRSWNKLIRSLWHYSQLEVRAQPSASGQSTLVPEIQGVNERTLGSGCLAVQNRSFDTNPSSTPGV
ncbi:hypothetical protein BaRGS_00000302, partial [Batillaria attramentaria]